jgi:signal transduction histidine kinase
VTEPVVRKSTLSFRTKLLVTMMLVVTAISLLTLYIAENRTTNNLENELRQEFQSGLAALHQSQEVRHAALLERCRTLVKKSRIHAALEDNALDLLYPSAREELRDVMENPLDTAKDSGLHGLTAKFYRFLDRDGLVISPAPEFEIGHLSSEEEAQLSLPHTPTTPQLGYVRRGNIDKSELYEVIAMPIVSSETGEFIATLVLGFAPMDFSGPANHAQLISGIHTRGRLYLQKLSSTARDALGSVISNTISDPPNHEGSHIEVEGAPYLLFQTLLNQDSLFPPAREVSIYPLAEFLAQQRELRWQIIGVGGFILLIGFFVSHFFATRLSQPVEKLAFDSANNFALRQRAEAALETTSRELQRSVRFSADASHQLKTPITVLRAGLEELLARPHLSPEHCDELADLVHQTYRLSSVIEDLLLLSRMEGGHLEIKFLPVNLSHLIDSWLDDLSAIPDPLNLKVGTTVPPNTYIAGEQRYVTLILQNLLENARKYNRPGGRVHVGLVAHETQVVLTIGNTGQPIAPDAQEHVFERFHRGTVGENIPGHGLGLNLARELSRLHRGELRLVRSEDDWTEFEVRFCPSARP